MSVKKIAALLIPAALSSSLTACSQTPTEVQYLVPEIIATHPFNEESFTQGLEVDGDRLLVSTGQYGQSRVYETTVEGQEGHSASLTPEYFGEGITKTDDSIWQLTWKAGVAFKRDANTLDVVDQVSYEGEGWGICAAHNSLIMSDGSSTLTTRDKETFEELSRIDVTLDGAPVNALNELECVGDMVYANIFQSTDIVQIDSTGKVTAVIDASSLPNNAASDINNVLNGIAAIPESDRFYLAGKRWPDLYEVRFVEAG